MLNLLHNQLLSNVVGEWALVDLSSIIVHVMTDEIRDRYQLEELWN